MIAEAIFSHAQRWPEKPAIIFSGEPISYRKITSLIAMARRFFARRGYVGEGYALIASSNLLDFWICSLALRSLGLTTLQIPGPGAVGAVVRNARCFVVTIGGNAWRGLPAACEQRGLELVHVHLAGEPELDLNQGPSVARQGGHLLSTSGTTGDYKLVLMSAEADAVFLRRKNEVIGMDQNTVLAAFNFPAWTAAGYRWAASPWRVGGTVVIEQRQDVYRALRQPNLTHAVMVPSVLEQILAAPEGAFPHNDRIQVSVGGGAMTDRQLAQVKERVSSRVFNLLASTEGGVIAHTQIHKPADMVAHDLVADRLVEVVDDHYQSLSAGEVGRVRVGVHGLVDGYLNNEAATAECFREGFFYPGDLAKMLPDGRLVLQGRVSDVLNIGGFKVLPFPLEQRLAENLGVLACIFAMPAEDGREELHIVLETENAPDEERVLALLRGEAKFVSGVKVHSLKRFARNDMGKVVRQDVRKQISAAVDCVDTP